MKIRKLIILGLGLLLSACSSNGAIINIDDYANKTVNTGSLSAFDLVDPINGKIVEDVKEFSWNKCENAETYKLEICSNERFISGVSSIDYYSKNNITATSFKINSMMAFKDTNYYWRVTAYNSKEERVSDSVFSFFVKAQEVQEVEIDLGEADDWTLHPHGSYADVFVDNSNFFNNDHKSIAISFKQEDTKRGEGYEMSDGWIVVTKTVEKSFYGTDALFFNLFYAGQDATVKIRVVDRDNEYWECPVQVSNNAKQQVILKFSEFIQRTKDVTIGNLNFDHERIKYFEIVFEKSFGDGILLISNVKAIKFSNYRSFFIEKLDFSEFSEADFTNENYVFEKELNGYELTLSHYGTNTEGKAKINGYGFAKLNVNRYLYTGDAIKFSVKYSGTKGTNVLLRVLEEDRDRWSYSIPYSSLSSEYTDVIIPYKAFAKSDASGDGKRQFYFIQNFQFGCQGQNGTGTLSFKDFEIVQSDRAGKRVVGSDGLVENFNDYEFSADMFLAWDVSENNKDEYMSFNTTFKAGGSSNPQCGQIDYKTDMEAALYTLPVEVKSGFTSFSLDLRDASIRTGEARAADILEYSPDVIIYIRLVTGEIYQYVIESLPRMWLKYDIPFSSFEIANKDDLRRPPVDIASENITHIAIALQFFYVHADGRREPCYANNNPVYIDNIYFANGVDYAADPIVRIVETIDNIALLDDFEEYGSSEDLSSFWSKDKGYEYEVMELSDDVSSQGGTHSLALGYKKGAESPAYYIEPAMSSNVSGCAVRLDLKGDYTATVYINISITVSGSTIKFRATLTANENWTEHVIGFESFEVVEGNKNKHLTSSDLVTITRISFGVVSSYGSDDTNYVYIDNFKFDSSVEYDAIDPKTVIE